ncbi:MAG: metallophosphoesterase, partial [Clostridia bacterium]|nr:metallophosphoesterase [Clostridia bacterium]
GYFLDEACKKPTNSNDIILYSPWNIPDFIVEVPEGREPIVLQLTDTQIMDSTQDINGVLGGSQPTIYHPSQMNVRCFDYLTDIITATNPDLIILTGDNVYGKFDHNGSVWTKFVNFMDSFDIPWAPIFGNHDGESNMGVDWQCEQLMNAENCLFKQRTLTGNCNYSVAIAQGNEIKRVFYMLDSNGVGSPSAATLANGHTSTIPGFGSDQVAWYTEEITKLQDNLPDIKISFAYHIQDNLFELAYAKYGYVTWQPWANINVDLHKDKAEGDFGYIGYVKGEWTQNIDKLKALNVDSIFVGHEHTSSSSVVYEGIRFQFGQKSSRYDMFSVLDAAGNVKHTDYEAASDSPLIGGSVIVLSEEDGAIADAYIYYCNDAHGKIANGEIQWASFLPATVEAVLPGKAYSPNGKNED